MKNILLLYKKSYDESKTVIWLYLLLLFSVSALFFHFTQRSFLKNFEELGDKDRMSSVLTTEWLIEAIAYTVIVIGSISLVICIHWGIRHFNYSGQRYHYNTLPLSLGEKSGYVFSYVFLLLPLLHFLVFGLALWLAVSLNPVENYFKGGDREFFRELLDARNWDKEMLFSLRHTPVFMAAFLVVSFLFNKMGFIKTVVSGFIIMLGGMMLFFLFDHELSATRGDFGSTQSLEHYPRLYTWHYIALTLFFTAMLFAVFQRLKDKNY